MGSKTGKDFEMQLRAAFQEQVPGAWTQRFTDSVSLRYDPNGTLMDLRTKKRLTKVHAKTPPDLLVVTAEGAALIECKAVRAQLSPRDGWGARIAFSVVEPHQVDHLVRFDALGARRAGLVAVLIYNEERGSARIFRAWLVPIAWWLDGERLLERKSVTMALLEEHLPANEIAWVPSSGGWQVARFVIDAARPVGS